MFNRGSIQQFELFEALSTCTNHWPREAKTPKVLSMNLESVFPSIYPLSRYPCALIYGCESWCFTKQLYHNTQSYANFTHACVRTMNHVSLTHSRMQRISSTKQIEAELAWFGLNAQRYILYIARRRQLRWLGLVSRMVFDRLLWRLFSSWLPCFSPKGAPEINFGKTSRGGDKLVSGI